MKLFKSLAIAAVAVVALAVPSYAQTTPLPTNVYGAGASYNRGDSTPVAATFTYAHAVTQDTAPGMYAFTVVDVLQNSAKPYTVNTNIGVGVANKVATIGSFPIYIPTSAGIALTSSNIGWNWSGGGATFIHLKGNYFLEPSVRFSKASVGGDGYKVIPGLQIVFGK